MKKKIEEYFYTPRSFFKFVVHIFEMMKFNQDLKTIDFPVFDCRKIRFDDEFSDYDPTIVNEIIRLINPFYKGMIGYEWSEWIIFKEILKKFKEYEKV